MSNVLEHFNQDIVDVSAPRASARVSYDVRLMLQLITNYSPDLLTVHTAQGECVYASGNAEQLFGWRSDELHGRPMFDFVHPSDVATLKENWTQHTGGEERRMRFRLRCASSEYRWVESRTQLSGDLNHVVASTRDIHHEMEQLEELERAASYDALTNVLNRRALEQALEAEWQRCNRSKKALCMAFFDVDRFKQINDVYGHEAGDQVLRTLSQCVDHHKRRYDTLGRWGGDEFVLLMPETDINDAEQVIHRIRDLITQDLPGISLSFGLSSTLNATTSGELLTFADIGMYQSKKLGGNQVTHWYPQT